jgi:histidyl-tRNA synthetase
MEFRAVKGMNDILPQELSRWQRLERTFQRVVERYGYREVRTPVLEHTDVFVRSIGEATDIVEKEMFTFTRSDESLTLRPEGTAGAVRAYVTNSVNAREPVSRWYYLGPMFRAERPQRGRYRQFYQAGCELYGDPGPICDAEMIDMLFRLLGELGIGGLQVRLSSIGGAETRDRYRAALTEYLRPRAQELSEHAQRRLETNPLRVLDSKDPRDQAVAAGAPSIIELLTEADREHWQGLCSALDQLGTTYRVDSTLVRGLDYYSRTLFEITASSGGLGSQNTLVGGGRYDGLVREMGGPEVPSIGFAMGLERVLLAMPEAEPELPAFCYFAPIGEAAARLSLSLANEVRQLGGVAEVDGRSVSVRAKLRRANATSARLCVILGDSELEAGVVTLKDLFAHTEEQVARTTAASVIADRLRGSTTSDRSGSRV